MELLLKIISIFVIGGTVGWIMEFFYRRYAHGKWVNPGFLTGPCLPIYGSGLLLLYAMSHIDYSFAEPYPVRVALQILSQSLILTGIEYVTGFAFVNVFHVRLWDYSNRRGNIQGIICPFFTLIWGTVGAIYSFFLHRYVEAFVSYLTKNPIMSFCLGIYSGILIVDICYSFRIVTRIKKFVGERDLIVKYENLKLSVRTRTEMIKGKKPFFFFFGSKHGFADELEHYIATFKERQNGRKDKSKK